MTAETSNQNSFLLNDRKGVHFNEDDSDNGQSPIPTQRQTALKNKTDILILKEIDNSVVEIESKLRVTNMIKGHANNLKKLQNDVQKQIMAL